jgi:tRNA-splicing ligase RtcB
MWKEKLKKQEGFWLLPKTARQGMNVNGKIIANNAIMDVMEDEAIQQLSNVAMLPGIVEPVIGLPDAHIGYGLPMGAVGAFGKDGVISAGMTGFDINCGLSLIRTNLTVNEVKKKLSKLLDVLFNNVPCGVGCKGKLKLNIKELDNVLMHGIDWCINNGFATQDDKKATEENGKMQGDPSKVSDVAKKRGMPQLGTLGAGNHFLEIQKVDRIYNSVLAKKYGIHDNQVTIMLHSGSRGLGHQVATDYLKIHAQAVKHYGIKIPDQQLVCAPVNSKQGQDYFKAMQAAVNYAFCNRQIMIHFIRKSFEQVFGKTAGELDMKLVYSICHNIAKHEKHIIP